jgi:hypothetical protein
MWVVSLTGFYSVVVDSVDTNRLVVRTRVRRDLVRLKRRYLPSLTHVAHTPGRDYQFRAFCRPAAWADAAAAMVRDISYSNFKYEISKTEPRRAEVYANVWGSLLQLVELAP